MDSKYSVYKSFRLLNIYEKLNRGEVVLKSDLSEEFGVSNKTIQRDISDLRAYFLEKNYSEIKYNKEKGTYYLEHLERQWLTNQEVLILCKILLESRALCKTELKLIIDKLTDQVLSKNKKIIKNMISNEYFNYVPLKHGKELIDIIWEIAQYIYENEIICFNYKRQDSIVKMHTIKPVSIMFSEFYFYLIGFGADGKKTYPIVYRVDRIENLKGTNEKFNIPYRDRFEEGEFRKRVQFMYPGELQTVRFTYSGYSIEAVLDRLPTAVVKSCENGIYTIEAEVYGNGIDMWLRSQGNIVKRL